MISKERKPKRLFISGMMRSGTTLLQRALDAHPEIQVHYQSSTEYLLCLKKKFLNEIGRSDYHILAHYNPSPGYKYSEFLDWQRRTYSNGEGIFSGVASEGHLAFGIKEILAEEFYPSLLKDRVYCINIIRDPRDVISSTSFGNGAAFTGKPRPVLFDLRNWRKSVHFSRRLNADPYFRTVVFEELVADPESILGELFEWLNVPGLAANFISEKMQENSWGGNSSFSSRAPFDKSAIGGYENSLPESVLSYVEATCLSEMDWLGYPVQQSCDERRKIIEMYKDPFQIDRPEFECGYSYSGSNINYELKRLEKNISELNDEIFE